MINKLLILSQKNFLQVSLQMLFSIFFEENTLFSFGKTVRFHDDEDDDYSDDDDYEDDEDEDEDEDFDDDDDDDYEDDDDYDFD